METLSIKSETIEVVTTWIQCDYTTSGKIWKAEISHPQRVESLHIKQGYATGPTKLSALNRLKGAIERVQRATQSTECGKDSVIEDSPNALVVGEKID